MSKLQLRDRGTPDPAPFDLPTYRGEAVSALLDGVVYLLSWIPRLLLLLFVDLPAAAFRAARSDEWIVDAISWAPYQLRYKWSVSRERRGQVVALVEGSLARGEEPRPQNARRLDWS